MNTSVQVVADVGPLGAFFRFQVHAHLFFRGFPVIRPYKKPAKAQIDRRTGRPLNKPIMSQASEMFQREHTNRPFRFRWNPKIRA